MKNKTSRKSPLPRNSRFRASLVLLSALAVVFAGWLYFGQTSGVSFAQDNAGKQDPTETKTPISQEALRQMAGLAKEKRSRTPTQKKIDSRLLYQLKMERRESIADGVETLDTGIAVDDNGFVDIDITANVSNELLAYLKKADAKIIASFPQYRSITARVPIISLEDLAAQPGIIFIMPKQEGTTNKMEQPMLPLLFGGSTSPASFLDLGSLTQDNFNRLGQTRERLRKALSREMLTGSVEAESDTTHRANVARLLTGFDGTGIKIGVLSNGVDSLAARQATGDLPAVNVLPGQAGTGDEGTAMLELVHDSAPGATLYYATANGSFAGFAQNIRDLRTAGCDIIVDDYTYFYETPFQDGQAPSVIASTNGGILIEAVNDVTVGSQAGALYFSSAANSGNKNDGTAGAWEGDFVDGGVGGGILAGAGILHNFGSGTDDQLTVAGRVILKWSDPLGGSANDYDLFVLNSAGTSVVAVAANVQNGTQDPIEDLGNRNANERIVIAKFAGAARFLHLNTNRGRLAVSTSGVVYGHNAGRNTISVAASPAGPAVYSISHGPYPDKHGSSNVVEIFSSDGPRRIFFNADGSPLTPGNQTSTGGELLQKPDITAADGSSTTTPGFMPFFGTSAAAPQASAMMALLKQASPSSTRTQLFNAMISSAIDIEGPGVDRDSGAGIFMPLRAMSALGVTGQAYLDKGDTTPTQVSGNNNTIIEPGEIWNFAIALDNIGLSNASNVTATLSTTTPNVVILPSATRSYPNIASAVGSANSATPFQFQLLSGFPCGATINFTLTVNFIGGASPRVINIALNTGKPSNISTILDTTAPPTGIGYTASTGLQTGRLVRNAVNSTCALAKSAPGLQDSLPNRQYDAYTFTASTSGCTTVTFTTPVANLFVAVYGAGGYVPGNPNANYLADPGTSSTVSEFSFNAVGGQTYTIVVHEITPSSGSIPANYTLNVSGPIQGVCLSPTAANVSVIGRTMTANGRSIANALVTLSDAGGNSRSARTNTFGYYRIDRISVGVEYILSANAKQYTFVPRVLNVNEDLTGVDLIAQ